MVEDCKNNVKKVNTAIDSLKSKANLYANVTNLNNNKLKEPLKDLVHASAPGKKVNRIGWAMFWIPEPTMISNLVGLPMIVGGKLLDRYYSGTTIKHVGEEARKTLNSLQEFFK
jgi:hypothetical protein